MTTALTALFALIGLLVTLAVVLPAAFESISRKFKLGEWQFRSSLRMVVEAWARKL